MRIFYNFFKLIKLNFSAFLGFKKLKQFINLLNILTNIISFFYLKKIYIIIKFIFNLIYAIIY